MRSSARRRTGFTIIETLITVTIIGILSAIVFGDFIRQRPRAELKGVVRQLQNDLQAMQTNAQGGVAIAGVAQNGFGVYLSNTFFLPAPFPANTKGYVMYGDAKTGSVGLHDSGAPDTDLTYRAFPKNVDFTRLTDSGGAKNYSRADVVYAVPNGRAVVTAYLTDWETPGAFRIIIKQSKINVCYSIDVASPIGTVSSTQLSSCP